MPQCFIVFILYISLINISWIKIMSILRNIKSLRIESLPERAWCAVKQSENHKTDPFVKNDRKSDKCIHSLSREITLNIKCLSPFFKGVH